MGEGVFRESGTHWPDQNLVRENDHLRRETCILMEEREVLK
jgi:hypothetical protein